MDDPQRAYQDLIGRLDDVFARTRARYPDDLVCRAGCTDCCRCELTLFPIEALRLAAAVRSLSRDVRDRVRERAGRTLDDSGFVCPLLEDDRCLVYPARSVICRTHGLPTLFEDASGKRDLSLCPYNFRHVEHVAGDCVLDLNLVNQILATVNRMVCATLGISPERVRIGQVLLGQWPDGDRSLRG